MRRGTVDFAVVSTPVKADAPLHMTMLHPYQEILIGGTEFGHLAGKQTTFEEIMQYPLICLGKETVTFQFYRQLFASYGLDFEPDTETATADQILPLVRSGLGLAFIPNRWQRMRLTGERCQRYPCVRRYRPEYLSDL